MLRIPEYQIYEPVQAYIKQYPQKAVLIQFDTPRDVRITGYEPQSDQIHSSRGNNIAPIEDSIRRTKVTISDLVICNQFDLFCTFTFDPKKIDRGNPEKCKKAMAKWLKNQRDYYGKFEYLIVPEFHKDGKSLHFHALLKNYKGNLKLAKLRKHSSRKTYNISSYRLGYSTAVEIDKNIEKVGSYIKKYITKDMPMFAGKKRYWCSTGLTRPIVTRNPQLDPWTLDKFVLKYNTKGLSISEVAGTVKLLSNKELEPWQTPEIKPTLTTLLRASTSSQPSVKAANYINTLALL